MEKLHLHILQKKMRKELMQKLVTMMGLLMKVEILRVLRFQYLYMK